MFVLLFSFSCHLRISQSRMFHINYCVVQWFILILLTTTDQLSCSQLTKVWMAIRQDNYGQQDGDHNIDGTEFEWSYTWQWPKNSVDSNKTIHKYLKDLLRLFVVIFCSLANYNKWGMWVYVIKRETEFYYQKYKITKL